MRATMKEAKQNALKTKIFKPGKTTQKKGLKFYPKLINAEIMELHMQRSAQNAGVENATKDVPASSNGKNNFIHNPLKLITH